MRKAMLALVFLSCAVLMSLDGTATAQNATAPRVRIISQAEIQKGLDTAKPALGIVAGQTVQVAPEVLVRRRLEGPNNASIHSTVTDGDNVTEVMVITGGSGSIMIGGTYVDPNPEYSKKDRSKGITGGVTHDVAPGDVIVISPGISHWFTKINGQITMVEARFDISAPPTFMSKAAVWKAFSAANWGIGGQTHAIIPASKPTMANSVVVRHREKGRPNDASIHSTETDGVNATEVMIVLEGGGTFMTEGTYVDATPDYRKKDRTKGITGGVTREVKAGDILVYAPGTTHWFSNVPDQVTMIELRIPGDVTKGNQ